MKIVVLTGSPRKKDSCKIIHKIEKEMKDYYNAEFEYINISTCNINDCIGCMQCFEKGEGHCPFNDDVEMIRSRLIDAEGIIFASPVYAIGITGTMKKLVDRLSYMFHRPELIAKPSLTIVTTGGGGQKKTQQYLKLISSGWGCSLVGSISVISPFYFNNNSFYRKSYEISTNKKLTLISKKFGEAVSKKKRPVPSLYDVYMFNGLKSKTFTSEADYKYWQENNWLDSNYYYETNLGPIKWLFGKSLELIVKAISKKVYNNS